MDTAWHGLFDSGIPLWYDSNFKIKITQNTLFVNERSRVIDVCVHNTFYSPSFSTYVPCHGWTIGAF